MLPPFDLHRPGSLAGAVALKADLGEDAAWYAGGTELLLGMRMGVIAARHLIDVKWVPELTRVERAGRALRIGAAVTHHAIELHPLVRRVLPALAELERQVGNPRVRAMGTLGGNLAFGEPHADPPTLLLALSATLLVEGPAGRRRLGMETFAQGFYQTALAPDELLVAVEVPLPARTARVAYLNFRVQERPSAAVALVAEVEEGRFRDAPRLVVGAVGEVPCAAATEPLRGAPLADPATATGLARAASAAADPIEDLSGDAGDKRQLAGVLARRALARLAADGSAA